MPYHKEIDIAREKQKGVIKIGTTGRGIGPCYEDKANRKGIRMIDLLSESQLRKKVDAIVKEKNFYLVDFLKSEPINPEEIIENYIQYGNRLRPHVTNISVELAQNIKNKQHILFEGAQGTHLDIDHGTYPFVTSSNTVSGNACCGAGVGPKEIGEVIGIVKAYTTRVGAGPFPTELEDEIGNFIQEKGAEFGATTGRRRRCGWLDLVLLRNAVRLNGITGLAITKLDVLGGIETLKICNSYDYKGERVDEVPSDADVLEECQPILENIPGWKEDLSNIRSESELPKNTIAYLKKIEEILQVPVKIISIGPGRDQTIVKANPFI